MTADRDISVPDLLGAKAVMLPFLEVELDIATAFVESAKAASSLEVRKWDCNEVRKAYDTVARMINRVTLSSAEAALLNHRLTVLKTTLQQLGNLS